MLSSSKLLVKLRKWITTGVVLVMLLSIFTTVSARPDQTGNINSEMKSSLSFEDLLDSLEDIKNDLQNQFKLTTYLRLHMTSGLLAGTDTMILSKSLETSRMDFQQYLKDKKYVLENNKRSNYAASLDESEQKIKGLIDEIDINIIEIDVLIENIKKERGADSQPAPLPVIDVEIVELQLVSASPVVVYNLSARGRPRGIYSEKASLGGRHSGASDSSESALFYEFDGTGMSILGFDDTPQDGFFLMHEEPDKPDSTTYGVVLTNWFGNTASAETDVTHTLSIDRGDEGKFDGRLHTGSVELLYSASWSALNDSFDLDLEFNKTRLRDILVPDIGALEREEARFGGHDDPEASELMVELDYDRDIDAFSRTTTFAVWLTVSFFEFDAVHPLNEYSLLYDRADDLQLRKNSRIELPSPKSTREFLLSEFSLNTPIEAGINPCFLVDSRQHLAITTSEIGNPLEPMFVYDSSLTATPLGTSADHRALVAHELTHVAQGRESVVETNEDKTTWGKTVELDNTGLVSGAGVSPFYEESSTFTTNPIYDSQEQPIGTELLYEEQVGISMPTLQRQSRLGTVEVVMTPHFSRMTSDGEDDILFNSMTRLGNDGSEPGEWDLEGKTSSSNENGGLYEEISVKPIRMELAGIDNPDNEVLLQSNQAVYVRFPDNDNSPSTRGHDHDIAMASIRNIRAIALGGGTGSGLGTLSAEQLKKDIMPVMDDPKNSELEPEGSLKLYSDLYDSIVTDDKDPESVNLMRGLFVMNTATQVSKVVVRGWDPVKKGAIIGETSGMYARDLVREQNYFLSGNELDTSEITENNLKSTVTGVEMYRKILDRGEAGDNVGFLLRGIEKADIKRGLASGAENSYSFETKTEEEVYVLSKEEGGRHSPFFNNYRPQFYFRTTDVTGEIILEDGREMVMPGDNVNLDVNLIAPIAMEKGLRFAIREGGRTIGTGTVSDRLDMQSWIMGAGVSPFNPAAELNFNIDSFFDISPRTNDYNIDSFFDIEYRASNFNVDSFFDIEYRIDYNGRGGEFNVDSFFDVFYEIDDLGSNERGITINSAHAEYETSVVKFPPVDASDSADHKYKTSANTGGFGGAIWLEAGVTGSVPQTREHILLGRQVAIPVSVNIMNKVDMVDDEELLELVEMELTELLSFYEYDGDNVPVIQGSALRSYDVIVQGSGPGGKTDPSASEGGVNFAIDSFFDVTFEISPGRDNSLLNPRARSQSDRIDPTVDPRPEGSGGPGVTTGVYIEETSYRGRTTQPGAYHSTSSTDYGVYAIYSTQKGLRTKAPDLQVDSFFDVFTEITSEIKGGDFVVDSFFDITYDVSQTLDTMYNPFELHITKSTPWQTHHIAGLDSPTLQWTSGESMVISVELFFDTYEKKENEKDKTLDSRVFTVDSFFDISYDITVKSSPGSDFRVDSFFDISIDLIPDNSGPEGGSDFNVDSFFDISYETSIIATELDAGRKNGFINLNFEAQGKTGIVCITFPCYNIDSFFDVSTELSVDDINDDHNVDSFFDVFFDITVTDFDNKAAVIPLFSTQTLSTKISTEGNRFIVDSFFDIAHSTGDGRKYELRGHVTVLKGQDTGGGDPDFRVDSFFDITYSTADGRKYEFRGHVTVLKGQDTGGGDSDFRVDSFFDITYSTADGRKYEFRGHVTVLKGQDTGGGDGDFQVDSFFDITYSTADDRKFEFRGHVTVLKGQDTGGGDGDFRVDSFFDITYSTAYDRKYEFRGHVTVLKGQDTGGGDSDFRVDSFFDIAYSAGDGRKYEFRGHVTVLKGQDTSADDSDLRVDSFFDITYSTGDGRKYEFRGHVTVLKGQDTGGGDGDFRVDSFFDIFTEANSVSFNMTSEMAQMNMQFLARHDFQVDSFFDISLRIRPIDGKNEVGSWRVDSFFDIDYQAGTGDRSQVKFKAGAELSKKVNIAPPGGGGGGTEFQIDSFFDVFFDITETDTDPGQRGIGNGSVNVRVNRWELSAVPPGPDDGGTITLGELFEFDWNAKFSFGDEPDGSSGEPSSRRSNHSMSMSIINNFRAIAPPNGGSGDDPGDELLSFQWDLNSDITVTEGTGDRPPVIKGIKKRLSVAGGGGDFAGDSFFDVFFDITVTDVDNRAAVIPLFSSQTLAAKVSTLKSDLASLRFVLDITFHDPVTGSNDEGDEEEDETELVVASSFAIDYSFEPFPEELTFVTVINFSANIDEELVFSTEITAAFGLGHTDDRAVDIELVALSLRASSASGGGGSFQTEMVALSLTSGSPTGGGGAPLDPIDPREILKTYFETGDIPTEEQFNDLIDSLVNLVEDRTIDIELVALSLSSSSPSSSGGRTVQTEILSMSLSRAAGNGTFQTEILSMDLSMTAAGNGSWSTEILSMDLSIASSWNGSWATEILSMDLSLSGDGGGDPTLSVRFFHGILLGADDLDPGSGDSGSARRNRTLYWSTEIIALDLRDSGDTGWFQTEIVSMSLSSSNRRDIRGTVEWRRTTALGNGSFDSFFDIDFRVSVSGNDGDNDDELFFIWTQEESYRSSGNITIRVNRIDMALVVNDDGDDGSGNRAFAHNFTFSVDRIEFNSGIAAGNGSSGFTVDSFFDITYRAADGGGDEEKIEIHYKTKMIAAPGGGGGGGFQVDSFFDITYSTDDDTTPTGDVFFDITVHTNFSSSDEPDSEYRVKVKFPWVRDEETGSSYTRLAIIYGSDDRSNYFRPEIDDEVLVLFESGDIRMPIVIGALWNGVDTPPELDVEVEQTIDGKTVFSSSLSLKNNSLTYDETHYIQDVPGLNEIILDLDVTNFAAGEKPVITARVKHVTDGKAEFFSKVEQKVTVFENDTHKVTRIELTITTYQIMIDPATGERTQKVVGGPSKIKCEVEVEKEV